MVKDERRNIKMHDETFSKFNELKSSKYESYDALIDRLHCKFCKDNPKSGKCKKIKKGRLN